MQTDLGIAAAFVSLVQGQHDQSLFQDVNYIYQDVMIIGWTQFSTHNKAKNLNHG